VIFNSECTRNRLSAGLHPGELAALLQPLSLDYGGPPERCAGRGKAKGNGNREEGISGKEGGMKESEGKEGTEGEWTYLQFTPPSPKC